MTYAVFILTSTGWKMHGTFSCKSDALREKTYLVSQFGVSAEVFQK